MQQRWTCSYEQVHVRSVPSLSLCSAVWEDPEETTPASTCASSPLRAAPPPTPPLKSNVGVDLWPHCVSVKATKQKLSPSSGDAVKIKKYKNDLSHLHQEKTFSAALLCFCVYVGADGWVGDGRGGLVAALDTSIEPSGAQLSGSRWCLVCLMALD